MVLPCRSRVAGSSLDGFVPVRSQGTSSGRPRKRALERCATPTAPAPPCSLPSHPGRLAARFAEEESRFASQDVTRPPYWSGYIIVPARIEFWQGRASRLHDRVRFSREGGDWTRERLAP